MLGFQDPLPHRPARILVAGVSGVGKTTLARQLAVALSLRHTDLDGLYHGAGWVPRTEFLDEVASLAAESDWVTEWQYRRARPLLLARTDLLVWLDLPYLSVTFPRLLRRTIVRRWRREELWNGNMEPSLLSVFTDPGHVVRWSISTRRSYRERVPAVVAERPDLAVVRLRTPAQVRAWLAGPVRQVRDAGGGTTAAS